MYLEKSILHHRRIHKVIVIWNKATHARTDNAIERNIEIRRNFSNTAIIAKEGIFFGVKEFACNRRFFGRDPYTAIQPAQRYFKIRGMRRGIVLRIPFRKIPTNRKPAPLAANFKRFQFFSANFFAADNKGATHFRNRAKYLHRQKSRCRAIFIGNNDIATFRNIHFDMNALDLQFNKRIPKRFGLSRIYQKAEHRIFSVIITAMNFGIVIDNGRVRILNRKL